MTLIYDDTQDEKILPNINKGINYFFNKTIKGKDKTQWIAYNSQNIKGKTGTIALVSLSIIELLQNSNNIDFNERKNYEDNLDR